MTDQSLGCGAVQVQVQVQAQGAADSHGR
jgi:hypothetical protein